MDQRRTSAAPPAKRFPGWPAFIVQFLLLTFAGAAFAHPQHSEAIERPCTIQTADLAAPEIVGLCSFFIAADYLVFQMDAESAGESLTLSGAIHLPQATGSLFSSSRGPLSDGAVWLADASPEIVHAPPGVVAEWENGVTLAVSGDARTADGRPALAAQQSLPTPPGATAFQVFTRYVELGFLHILPRGLDHILFIIGLVLLSPRLLVLLGQISAFTVAHTVTLALGATGLVRLPAEIVEPLIAFSIVWIAIENLRPSEANRWRLGVIFGFGLLHGMGFADVLLGIGLDGAHFFSALLAFNIGVELGQLTIVIACLLLIAPFRNAPYYRPRIVVPASVAIALIAGYWVVERTFLS